MKKYLYHIFVALFAVSSLSLVSCSDDDDESNAMGKTIQINGKAYEIDPYITMEGSWNVDDDNIGTFTVSVFDQVGNAEDCLYYQFSYTDTSHPQVGDEFSTKSLELTPMDNADHDTFCFMIPLTYNSGTAKVVSINKDKDEMVVKFDNLTMSGDCCSYTFNGTVAVDFNFYR